MENGRLKKQKLLYLMHIDWHWIKQRPHFLAEGLMPFYDILIAYPIRIKRTILVSNRTDIKRFPVIQLPGGSFEVIAKLNKYLQKVFLNILIRIFRPDIVWLTFPTFYEFLKKNTMKDCRIVYDCMDDAVAFFNGKREKQSIYETEKKLLERANIVLVSSENLLKRLIIRGCSQDKMLLVRNAVDRKSIPEAENWSMSKKAGDDEIFRICFVGAIAAHLDFESILFCLENISNVEFNFIGPIVCNVPKHDRLFFHGPVNHSALCKIVSEYHCMIMPFKINDLTLSVDPVKLYEYINFNKNIISVYYDEIKKFSDFVYFYKDKEGLRDLIMQIRNTETIKYSQEERRSFLNRNTWADRILKIKSALDR